MKSIVIFIISIAIGFNIGYCRILNVPEDFQTIQAGIDAAEEGDTVLVAPGVYVEQLIWLGKSIVVASLALTTDNAAYIDSTIIDGEQNGSVVTFNEGKEEQSVLDGFTITDGSGYMEEGDDENRAWGGGVICINSSPTIRRCHIFDNGNFDHHVVFGGGVYCEEGSPILVDCIIEWNLADLGGGICTSGGSPMFIDCLIIGNAAFLGGGVACYGSASFVRCGIEGNRGPEEEGLSTPGIIAFGNFVRPEEPAIKLDSCFIDWNLNAGWGGGITNIGSYIRLRHCLIISNRSEFGSALFSLGGFNDVIQCVIYGNRAWAGSTICLSNGSVLDLNSTIITGYNDNIIESIEPVDWDEDNGRESNFADIRYCDIENGRDAVRFANEADSLCWSDDNFDEDPLFANTDSYDFHLTRNSPCIDRSDPELLDDPDATRADIGAFYYPQNEGEIRFRIALRQGWNMISSVCAPPDPNIPNVWSEIIAREHLILSKDQIGHFYVPSRNFNNIEAWDVRQGYYAKVSERDTLIISNIPAVSDTPIPLRAGWNIVAYFPDSEITAPNAFSHLGDVLILAKDDMGRFYSRESGFSNMGNLFRGKGYKLRVTEDAMLVWNDQQEGVIQFQVGEETLPIHYQPVITDRNMSVLIKSTISMNGEMAAFTESGLCVGACVAKGDGPWGMAVWGDDLITVAIDGLLNDEVIQIKYWDGIQGYSVSTNTDAGKITYASDGFVTLSMTSIQAEVPIDISLSTYPNPFNSTVTINYQAGQVSKPVSLAVYDTQGRLVADLSSSIGDLNRRSPTGEQRLVWEASEIPAGVYVVRMQQGSAFDSRKIVLMK